jgi:hypothetical protein
MMKSYSYLLTTLNKIAYQNWRVTGQKMSTVLMGRSRNLLDTLRLPIQTPSVV